VFYDTNSVDLDHFYHVRGRLEYVGCDEAFDDASLAERRTSRCGVCEVFEQADDTMLDLEISFGA